MKSSPMPRHIASFMWLCSPSRPRRAALPVQAERAPDSLSMPMFIVFNPYTSDFLARD